jgi:ribosomal protein S18 acetylase RimI-like enzyme
MTILATANHRAASTAMDRLLRLMQDRGTARRQGVPVPDRPVDTYLIRRARLRDMPAIIGLIDEAADWLGREKGTDQWRRPWPNRAARDQRIKRAVKSQRTWMVEEVGHPADRRRTPVATVTIGRGGNRKLWTQRERKEPAVYISRLIVSRRYARRGIGAALIDWVGRNGLRNWRAQWIRLDAWTTNVKLQDYYKKQGFTHLRTLSFRRAWDYPSAALFQKPTAEIAQEDAIRFQELS